MFALNFAGTLPIQATATAVKWDHLYIFLVGISAVFFVLVLGLMIYFAVNYRASRKAKPDYIEGNHLLEFVWTAVPTVLVLGIFVWGYVVYREMVESPPDAYEIHVIARQWQWQFQYDDGRTLLNKVYVPVGKPVKFIMSSEDVLHSFFVPNFRVKKDVVPGMYSHVWFQATVPGEHQVFCAEYCGTAHSGMLAKVVAVEPAVWEKWVRGKDISAFVKTPDSEISEKKTPELQRLSLADRGKQVAQDKGCIACHNVTGDKGIGPSWKGLFGKKEELQDGSSVTVDEAYVRESIENPQAKIVKGFNTVVMPPFRGVINEEEMNAIIAYIKSVK